MDIRTATTLRKNIIRTIRETADADDAADKIIGLVGEAECCAWQPIETAPKDGQAILLHGLCARPSIDAGKPATVIAYWSDINRGGWVWYGAAMTFTHWMPIPTPPSIALVDEAQSKAAGE